jgi:hypothetical protein
MGIPIEDEVPLLPTDDEPVIPNPPAPELPWDPEAPEPDAAEQADEVVAGWRVGRVSRDFEVPEADAIDQAMEVPLTDYDDV